MLTPKTGWSTKTASWYEGCLSAMRGNLIEPSAFFTLVRVRVRVRVRTRVRELDRAVGLLHPATPAVRRWLVG